MHACVLSVSRYGIKGEFVENMVKGIFLYLMSLKSLGMLKEQKGVRHVAVIWIGLPNLTGLNPNSTAQTSCVIFFVLLFNFPEPKPWVSLFKEQGNHCIYVIGFLWSLNGIIHGKYLAECLCHCTGFINVSYHYDSSISPATSQYCTKWAKVSMSLLKSLLKSCILTSFATFWRQCPHPHPQWGSWAAGSLCVQQPLFHVTVPQVGLSVSWLDDLGTCPPLLAPRQVGVAGQGYQSSSKLKNQSNFSPWQIPFTPWF